MSNNNLEKVDFSSMTKDEVIAYFVKENTDLKQKNLQLEQDKAQLLLLFKSGINLLTRFGKTNPINFDKNLNSISGSLSNKKAA